MKKFKFSLSHMKDYKERILDEEKGTLLRLRSQRDQIQLTIDNLTQEFQELSAQMKQEQEKGTTMMILRGYAMQIDNTREHLKDLRSQLRLAQSKVDEQMSIVVEANQEVSKLDKLQDKQYEDYCHKETKAEELRIEELVMMGIIRKEPEE